MEAAKESDPSSPSSPIPSIHLLCMEEKYISAWEDAVETYELPASVSVTIQHDRLAELSSAVKFDAIVSPANSYGRMDGGFDDALSRAFSPKQDYLALTRVVQAKLLTEWRGYAPPGSCTMIDLEETDDLKKNEWKCRYLALCPTMKIPQNVLWDREVVYECMWALLAAVDKHNRKVTKEVTDGEIKSFLMTPLATGFGRWSPERWAAQTVIAIRHFVETVENADKWQTMGTFKAFERSEEVEKTYEL